MARLLIALALGLAIGIATMIATRPPAPEVGGQPAPGGRPDAEDLGLRVSALERQVTGLADELRATTAELAAVRAERNSREESVREALSEPRRAADAIQSPQSSELRIVQRSGDLVEQLVEGGFTPQRAEWINRRSGELTMQMIQERNQALREDPVQEVQVSIGPREQDRVLRQEMGDIEYEKYLRAIGQDPYATVMDVIASSPAAAAGVQPGDKIVSYGGTRVMNFLEVTPLTMAGKAGEQVIVDILRDDQPMQIVVPRGALGVRLGTGDSPSSIVVVPRP